MKARTALCVLCLAGAACLPAGFQLARDHGEPPVSIPFGVTVDEIARESRPVVWVDARPDELYRAGHIPGALNLNRDNWNKALSGLFAYYAPGREVIVYCSAGCVESQEIADQIRDMGLDPVLVLEGGFDAWQKRHAHGS